MKNLVTFLIALTFVGLFTSCKKSEITPGNYQTVQPTPTTTTNTFVNGGTLPTNTTTPTSNGLSGTKWIVTEVTTPWPIVTTYPKDTVSFIDNTHYKVGANGVINTYNFYSNNVGSTLTMDNFVTINSLNFTCNNITYNSFSNVNVGGMVILKLKNVLIMSDIYTTIFKKI